MNKIDIVPEDIDDAVDRITNRIPENQEWDMVYSTFVDIESDMLMLDYWGHQFYLEKML